MRRVIAITILFLAVLTSAVFGQSGKGSISGNVTDTVNAVVYGAQVELLPKAGKTTTNAQGEFSFTSVPAGTYTLLINYVGFEPYSKEITVTPGQKVYMKAAIKVAQKADEITVFSERENGELEAINRTRTADNIVQILPA